MELKTLEIANFVLLALAAAVLWIFGGSHAGLKSAAWFGRGAACLACGALLVALRGDRADLLLITLINGLAVLGVLLINLGIAAYLGRPPGTLNAELGIWAAAMAGGAYFTFWHYDMDYRAALISAALGIELAISAWLLRQPATDAAPRLVSTGPVAAALGAFSGFNFLRAAATLLAAHQAAEARVQSAAAVGVMVFSVALTLGAVWLMTAELQAQLEQQAHRDDLTKLWNRRALEQAAAAAVESAARRGAAVAVIALDLDHFKRLNDTYGHAGGDTALRAVARLLAAGREPADRVARSGGEEFALLLPDRDRDAALAIAEDLRGRLASRAISFEGRAIHLTASFGVAGFEGPGDDWERMFHRADQALYAAKREGRNRVEARPATRAASESAGR